LFEKFLDEELIKIVDEVIGSFVGWELILLFNTNPSLRITEDELARQINREKEDLSQIINDFLAKGLIKEEGNFYTYKPSDKIKANVNVFINALNDRNKRLAIISQLLNK
jgi:predicted transcriptional regulator